MFSEITNAYSGLGWIVGQEAANSFVKIADQSGTESYANTTKLVSFGEGDVETGSDRRTKFQIIGGIHGVENNIYVVGERTGSDFISSGGRDEERYKSVEFRVENIIALAKRVPNNAIISLVTGLPAKHYGQKDIEQTVISALKGDYIVAVNGEIKQFKVDNVKILLQPLGTLMHRIYDMSGRLRQDRESEKQMSKLVIDIGWGTTDIAMLDGMRLEKWFDIDSAMVDAYVRMEELIRVKYPKLSGISSPLHLESKLRNSDEFSAGGVHYPAEIIAPIKQQALRETTAKIMTKIGNKGITLRDFDKTLFSGGGVEGLTVHIKPYTEGVNATRMAGAQVANALGFYTYGVIKQGTFV